MSKISGNTIVKCPHCDKEMEVDVVNKHVKKIFYAKLRECSDCNFCTYDSSHASHHKFLTKHTFKKFDKMNPLLKGMINAAANFLIESTTQNNTSQNVLPSSSSSIIDGDNVISKDLQKSSHQSPTNKDSLPVEENDDFILKTFSMINKIGLKRYNNCITSGNNTSVSVNVDTLIGSKTYEINVPYNDFNKLIKCKKCILNVPDVYLFRRKHIFENHEKDIKLYLKDMENLNKSDILFAGFKTIRDCFPDQTIFCDFQCHFCGEFCSTAYGMASHVALNHQTYISLKCPFDDCNFVSKFRRSCKWHIYKMHLQKLSGCSDSVSTESLSKYISKAKYRKLYMDFEIEKKITGQLVKYCFPISIAVYKNFDGFSKESLSEFKTFYFDEHSSLNLTSIDEELETDVTVTECSKSKSTKATKNTSLKRGHHIIFSDSDNNNDNDSDKDSDNDSIIFVKEVLCVSPDRVDDSEICTQSISSSNAHLKNATFDHESLYKSNNAEMKEEYIDSRPRRNDYFLYDDRSSDSYRRYDYYDNDRYYSYNRHRNTRERDTWSSSNYRDYRRRRDSRSRSEYSRKYRSESYKSHHSHNRRRSDWD